MVCGRGAGAHVGKVAAEVSKAVCPAYRVGVVFHANASGDGQVVQRLPLVLDVPAHGVERDRLGGTGGELL